MGMGLFCCAERTASGVYRTPVGEGETGTPPTLVTVNCAPCPERGDNNRLETLGEYAIYGSGELFS